MTQSASSSETRALALLGQGINPEQAAAAVGLSVSRISQLLSDETNAAAVAEARFKNLLANTERDAKYDDLEDRLLLKLKNVLVFMTNPREIIDALVKVNAAKRRGAAAPDSLAATRETIPLTLPSLVIKQFQVNITNQVIKAGDQELITVQSGQLTKLLENRSAQNVAPDNSAGA